MMHAIRHLRRVLTSRPASAGLALLAIVVASAAGLSWYLTAPLEAPTPDGPPSIRSVEQSSRELPEGRPGDPTEAIAEHEGRNNSSAQPLPEWPKEKLEGLAAKQLLLKSLELVDRSFSKVRAYTLNFRKQERIKGRLLPEQTYFVKVRQAPFAIYMKSIQPVKGRELIYAEGQFDNHVIGHPVGLSRLLVPRVKLPPDHPLILAESRHPLDRAGLGNLIRKMISVRKLDLAEPGTITVLDRTTTADGKHWFRSKHKHGSFRPERPFAETSILYDPVSRLPLHFTGYDFPERGQTEKSLGERYSYEDLDLDVSLTTGDFDPTNPEYAFHRL